MDEDVDSTEQCCGAWWLLDVPRERWEDKILHEEHRYCSATSPIHPHTFCFYEYRDISTHGNMPKIRDSPRPWVKPQHSNARNFSPEMPALLAPCIQLPVSLCSLSGEKDFVQRPVDTDSNAWVMSNSARTPGDETGRQLLHILEQYCRKFLFLATWTAIEYQQEKGGVGAAVWL